MKTLFLILTTALLNLEFRAFAQTENELVEGQVIVQNQDLNFGETFQKGFCDGEEITSFSQSVLATFAKNCCQIVIDRGEAGAQDVILQSGILRVKTLINGSHWIKLEGPNEPNIICNYGTAITSEVLEHAFGDVFKVKEVTPPNPK